MPLGMLVSAYNTCSPGITAVTSVCIDGLVPVRAEPDPLSERLTDLLFGETFTASSEREGLVFGSTEDGIQGFVPSVSLAARSGPATHRIQRRFIHVYQAPDLRNAAGTTLPMNSLVQLTGRSAAISFSSGGPASSMLELRSGGWISDQAVVPIGHFEKNWTTLAHSFVGAVYLHGGKTWLGCDGSGLVQTLFAAFGFRIPRQLSLQIQFFERQFEETTIPHTSAPLPASPIYFGSSCGLAFERSVVAARIETMQVDVTSLEEFLDPKRVHSDTRPRIFHPSTSK